MATKKTTIKKANGERAVIVTTEHRGVFFGYAHDTDGIAPRISATSTVMREEPEPTEEIANCTEILEAKQRAQMIVDEDGELATRSLWDIAGDGGDAYILTCSEW